MLGQAAPATEQPKKNPKKEEAGFGSGAHAETADLSRLSRQAGDANRVIKPKMNLVSSITSIFSDQVTITETDVSGLLDTLELALLEGDVAFEVSSEIVQSIRGKLVGAKVPKGKFADSIKQAIRSSLIEVMSSAGEY
ncbi:MAG TPA: signal recognition particle receptor subunit alpha, partial [Candidatus Micrarchaeota archaeon]|nr:signal recognition particle receptor subunit alpha [Candidatus Micrarchaeota archaeon]